MYVILFAFSLQQWFRERVLKLLYANIACLVVQIKKKGENFASLKGLLLCVLSARDDCAFVCHV